MKNAVVTKDKFIGTYKSIKYANDALSKYGHLFPVIPSPKLAKIVASLATDGFIDVRLKYKSNYYGYIGFFSKDKGELVKFEKLIFDLFKIKGTLRDWGIRTSGTSYGYIIINSFLSRLLTLCGVPAGNKVKKRYNVPDWILKGDKDIRSSFLERSFDCEGSIRYSKNRKRWEIAYCMYKLADLEEDCIHYLNQIRALLNEFGIDSILYKKQEYFGKRYNKIVRGYNIRIDKDKSVLNFAKDIGFANKNKEKKLVKAVDYISFRKNGPAEI